MTRTFLLDDNTYDQGDRLLAYRTLLTQCGSHFHSPVDAAIYYSKNSHQQVKHAIIDCERIHIVFQ